MVLAFHLCTGTALAPYTRWGWIGVEVFFVLSGFVIAYTAAGSSAGRFARNRVVRLMPAVWFCGTITALAWGIHGGLPDLGLRYLATLTLWPTGPWVDGAYWTLPVEVAFYALVFIALALRAFRYVEGLFATLCIASGAYWMTRLAGYAFVPSELATGVLLAHGCYFALGGALWAASTKGWTVSRVATATVSLGAGALQIVFVAHGAGGRSIIAPELVWLAAVSGIVFSVWEAQLLQAWLGRYSSGIRILGLMTYPLYLLHDDLGNMVRTTLPVPPLVAIALTGALFIAAAFVVARYVEPAIQTVLRRLLSGFPTRTIEMA